jgi:hypothetical protein
MVRPSHWTADAKAAVEGVLFPEHAAGRKT